MEITLSTGEDGVCVPDGSTIELVGYNKITAEYGIVCPGSLKIKGSGVLEIQCWMNGIAVDIQSGSLTIEGGYIKANGNSSGIIGHTVTITGGYIEATGVEGVTANQFQQTGGYLKATGASSNTNAGIGVNVNSGSFYITNGYLEAEGKTDSRYHTNSYGISAVSGSAINAGGVVKATAEEVSEPTYESIGIAGDFATSAGVTIVTGKTKAVKGTITTSEGERVYDTATGLVTPPASTATVSNGATTGIYTQSSLVLAKTFSTTQVTTPTLDSAYIKVGSGFGYLCTADDTTCNIVNGSYVETAEYKYNGNFPAPYNYGAVGIKSETTGTGTLVGSMCGKSVIATAGILCNDVPAGLTLIGISQFGEGVHMVFPEGVCKGNIIGIGKEETGIYLQNVDKGARVIGIGTKYGIRIEKHDGNSWPIGGWLSGGVLTGCSTGQGYSGIYINQDHAINLAEEEKEFSMTGVGFGDNQNGIYIYSKDVPKTITKGMIGGYGAAGGIYIDDSFSYKKFTHPGMIIKSADALSGVFTENRESDYDSDKKVVCITLDTNVYFRDELHNIEKTGTSDIETSYIKGVTKAEKDNGYTFAGWFSSEGTEETTENFTPGATYYARWKNEEGKLVRFTPMDFESFREHYGATVSPSDTTLYENTAEGWSWDTDDKVLTLAGATIDCAGFNGVEYYGISLPEGATIQLEEAAVNTVKGGIYNGTLTDPSPDSVNISYGIKGADIKIIGTGTLKVTANNITDTEGWSTESIGMDSVVIPKGENPTIEITTGSVNTTGESTNATSAGIMNGLTQAGGTVTVTAGQVDSANGTARSYGVLGSVNITEGRLTVSGYTQAVGGLTASEDASIKTSTTTESGEGTYDTANLSSYKWMNIRVLPIITVGTQTGTAVAETADTTGVSYTLTTNHFRTAPESFTLTWYSNAAGTEGATTDLPAGVTVKTNNSSILAFQFTDAVNTGTYYFRAFAAEDGTAWASPVATLQVGQREATAAMKTAAAGISLDGKTGATLTLPSLPAGAVYGIPQCSGTILCSAAGVMDSVLTFTAPASKAGDTGIITIPVTGAKNYKDYSVVVTVTSLAKTVISINGLSAPANRIYNTAAVADADFGTPSCSPVWNGTLEYHYYSGSAVTGTALAAKPKDAGSYILRVKIPASDADFAGYTDISFTIAKATVTAAADNKSITVGDALPEYTVKYSGFAGNDTSDTVLATPVTVSCPTADRNVTGSYPILVEGGAFAAGFETNYNLTYTNGTLTVNQIPHIHYYGADWKQDANGHWHECSCGDTTAYAAHTAGSWVVDTAATISAAGSRHKECTVCGRTMQTEGIPQLTQTPDPGSNPTPSGTADPEASGAPAPTGTTSPDVSGTPTGTTEPDVTVTPIPTRTPEAIAEEKSYETVIEEAGIILDRAVVDETAPKIKVSTPISELKEAVLTEEEEERIEQGETASIYLEIKDASETVAPEEKKIIEQELGEQDVAIYLDINLWVKVGDEEPHKISEPSGKVKISILIPEELRLDTETTARAYKIVHVHEGKTTIIDGEYNPKTGSFTFETDEFSTYALVYTDIEKSIEWAEAFETMEVGEKKTFTYNAVGYNADDLIWMTSKQGIATVAKNRGSASAVVNAKSAGIETLFVKDSNGRLLKLTITVSEKEEEKPAAGQGITPPQEVAYVVQKGDTLSKIAKKYKTSVKILVERNKLKNPDLIRIGQKLMITQEK